MSDYQKWQYLKIETRGYGEEDIKALRPRIVGPDRPKPKPKPEQPKPPPPIYLNGEKISVSSVWVKAMERRAIRRISAIAVLVCKLGNSPTVLDAQVSQTGRETCTSWTRTKRVRDR
jgi:hypothetical protein